MKRGGGDTSLAEGETVEEHLEGGSVFSAQQDVATTTQGTLCSSWLGWKVMLESLQQRKVFKCSSPGYVRPIVEEKGE